MNRATSWHIEAIAETPGLSVITLQSVAANKELNLFFLRIISSNLPKRKTTYIFSLFLRQNKSFFIF